MGSNPIPGFSLRTNVKSRSLGGDLNQEERSLANEVSEEAIDGGSNPIPGYRIRQRT